MPRVILVCFTLVLAARVAAADEPPAAGVEFFEGKIRPLLAENCYQCHGPEKQKANLRLDSPAAIRKGGDRGPALVAGDPDKSLLIQAVRYLDQEFRMPPRSKLKDQQIADLTSWVKQGAPLPKQELAGAGQALKTFDLAQRRQHWAYQSVRQPAIPEVKQSGWCAQPVDAFILAGLERAGLKPAAPADRRSLIRRVTFDLTGLPPSAEEVEAFVADTSPDAYERLVDRLLASPHYGERWGRHWLDLVRYSETLGHEFDYDIHNAWRYRDYVVRAFNEDLPYDQFVIEHLAGDLLPNPRRNPRTGLNESILGTGWFWLGEEKHSPVDVRQQQADRIDNQLDVFGKTFQAQTIACARCHDHKFDAITTQDYYSLAGYLKSSRYQQAFLDPPEHIHAKVKRLEQLKQSMRTTLADAAAKELADLPMVLQAARKLAATPKETTTAKLAQETGLDQQLLERWVQVLQAKQRPDFHPLYLWSALADPKSGAFERAWTTVRQKLEAAVEAARAVDRQGPALADFADPKTSGWFVRGEAFGARPTKPGELIVPAQPGAAPVAMLPAGAMHSGVLSPGLEGVLHSPSFTLDKRWLLIRAAGHRGRIHVVVDGLTIIRDPIYGVLGAEVNDETFSWRMINVSMWQGHRAYLEFADSATPNPSHPLKTAQPPEGAFIAVSAIHLTDQPTPPAIPPSALALRLARDPAIRTCDEAAEKTRAALAEAVAHWRSDRGDLTVEQRAGVELLGSLIEEGLLGVTAKEELARLVKEYRSVEASIPVPVRGVALADGTGEDEKVFIRGNYKTLGEPAPRRLPVAIAGPDQPQPREGSGRLELARRVTDPTNPLTARVIVNRLWQHHFGAGLVRSVDDFGRMGEAPSHPELLDYLATELVYRGWSLKTLHRQMLLSSTYQMASQGDAAAELADPQNRLLHRMPLRRLEAEAIRDAILSVSGQMKQHLGGPSIAPHLSAHMEGRGRPSASGPLDGQGRRSLYLNVRRNFLNPMFLAYDYPIPFSTVGKRTVSNVPSQALTLMNDPFGQQQARLWARRILTEKEATAPARVLKLYLSAFARPPSEQELAAAQSFLSEQAQRHGSAGAEDAWTDLCHVLLNTKEFVFLD